MKYVSEETAQDIATAAYNRSLQLSRPGTKANKVDISFTRILCSLQAHRALMRYHMIFMVVRVLGFLCHFGLHR